VTFWGKRDLRAVLIKALEKLDEHYGYPLLNPLSIREDRTPEQRKADGDE